MQAKPHVTANSEKAALSAPGAISHQRDPRLPKASGLFLPRHQFGVQDRPESRIGDLAPLIRPRCFDDGFIDNNVRHFLSPSLTEH
jgi:hypothetical protein